MADSGTIILQSHELITYFLEKKIIPDVPLCCRDKIPTASLVTTGVLIDPHHGLNDLINRKIRAVGDPVHRFTEDALRILR